MIIRELNTDRNFVTVTLSYNEVRCVTNSLYELSECDDIEKEKNFNIIHQRFIELFALVKHGHIPDLELSIMYKLMPNKDYEKALKELKENEG